MRFVGLDVHKRSTSMCILNQNGKVVKESRVPVRVYRVAA